MKILIIYCYFGTPSGSWSTRIYELSKKWIDKGAEVEIITAPYEKSDIKASRFVSKKSIENINLTIINSGDNNRLTFIERSIKALIFSFTSIFFVLVKKYDVLIASSGPITVGLPLIFAKKLKRKKTVFEVRDLWPEGAIQMKKLTNPFFIKLSKIFERQCYLNSNSIVTASPGMSAYVKEITGNKKDIYTFPNASDINLFNIPRTLPENYIEQYENKKIIVYTGSLGEMDECETAIQAMKFFLKKELALIFIGDGSERTQLEKLALKMNNPNIHFLGLIPKTEVVKWYSIADASLVGFKQFSVLSTSSPNKMFDSFAAGVPIIQNTDGWIQKLIENNGGGINVKCGSIEDYVQAYNMVLNDKLFMDEQRKKAFDLAKNHFDRVKIATEYYEMLKKTFSNFNLV